MLYIIPVLLTLKAAATDSPAGWQAYLEGDFARARTEASLSANNRPDADTFGLACQTGLIVGGFFESKAQAVQSLHSALGACDQALMLEPDHYVAGLSHAIALGFEGLRLRKASYARASKREIEALIAKYPRNAVARGALAGWHAAVAREGWLARLFLGASRARAKSLYKEAFALPGVELPLTYEYVRFLAAGNSAEQQQAQSLLNDALARSAQNGLEALLLRKMKDLSTALASGKKKEIKASIRATIPFGDIDRWGPPDQTNLAAYPVPEREVVQ